MRLTAIFTSLTVLSGLLLLAQCQPSAKPEGETETSQTTPDSVYIQQGKEIAGATFTTLSGELQGAMQSGGVAEAVRYCNLAALPLTDSLAEAHGVLIARVTDQPRNPDNRANAAEVALMNDYRQAQATGQPLAPVLRTDDQGQTVFHAPIVLMDLCQQCHGIPGETLPADNLAYIQELYPNDEATGYRAGELRGLWRITFLPE